MNKILLCMLTAACAASTAARAQTGTQVATVNPMPDGSRDMYLGAGALSAPRWEGADRRKTTPLPLIQVQWSTGIFVSGMTAGMHLSDSPTVEFGPLLALHPGRGESGTGRVADGAGPSPAMGLVAPGRPAAEPVKPAGRFEGGPLAGMDDIRARVLAGGFLNYYVAPSWRLTGSLLAGAGNERDGARLELGVQRLASVIGERHRVSLSAGIGIVNGAFARTFFGVTPEEAARSRFAAYEAGGGLQDAHAGVRWNWDWTPSWMLTSNLQAKRLLGSARRSPLVERPTNLTVSTAVAYRF
jgi:outer membrane protein